LPAFVCVVFGAMVQCSVTLWVCGVNSTQSLRPLLAFVCVVVFGLGRWCSTTCGCVGKFCTIVAAIAGFCLCCVWGDGAARLCGCVGKFCKIAVAIAGFCLCCVWGGCSDFVGAWVNSAQSLWLLPAFCLCCVWGGCSATCGYVGKFRKIVAAIAGLLFVLCLGWVQRNCGCVGKFRTIIAAIAGLLFVLCLGRWCT